MQICILTYHTVTAVPRCVQVSHCYMQSTSSKFFAQTHIHTHTHIFPVPTSEERGSVAVPGVTGSPSPQMTNRYNQLSRDPSCCCHIHYSWTNTYIKQSGATGHQTILTHTLISTHITATYLTHMHMHTQLYTHNCTHCQQSLLSHQHISHIKGIVPLTLHGT